MVVYYFQNLFADNQSSHSLHVNTLCNLPRLNQDQIEAIQHQFLLGELKDLTFSMHPDKAPGPDGFAVCFYQKFWNIVGKDIIGIV